MFLYQRMRCGESPGDGGVRSQGTLIGNPTTPVTLPGTVTSDMALVTNNTEKDCYKRQHFKILSIYLCKDLWNTNRKS